MSKQLTKEFSDDVTEYKQMEEEVKQNFLQGIIKLGEILKRQRDKWKPDGRWMEYLDKIDKHVSGANQFIRLYEYSQEHMNQLLSSNLTNWSKVNMFLALPEELREELAEKIGKDDLTNDQYREKISEVDIPKTDVVPDTDVPLDSPDLKDLMNVSATVDVSFMAKEILKGLKKEGQQFTNSCVPIIKAWIYLIRTEYALEDKYTNKMTLAEKRYWYKRLRNRIKTLSKLLN